LKAIAIGFIIDFVRQMGGIYMNKKGLIIEPQFGIRQLLKEQLKSNGYQTFEANCMSEIYETLTNHEIDFMILDINNPVTTGLGLVMKIKNFKPELKVFVMSANGESRFIQEAFELGASAYFLKPFNIHYVCNVIERELKENKEIETAHLMTV
jgi:two-component system, response regulator, stage 0 sporulation protein F